MAGYVRALPGRVARRSVGGGTAYQPSRGSRPLVGARLVVQRLRASPDAVRHELRKDAVRDYGAVGSANRLLLEREAAQRLKNNSPFVCCEPHAHPRRCWGHGASRLRCGDLPPEAAFRSAASFLAHRTPLRRAPSQRPDPPAALLVPPTSSAAAYGAAPRGLPLIVDCDSSQRSTSAMWSAAFRREPAWCWSACSS